MFRGLIWTALAACRPPEADPVAPAALYDDTRVLEVELALDASEWDALRAETRSLWDVYGGDCLATPQGSPFTWHSAEATIDGVAVGSINVRKKGLLGSLSTDRPSLKLDLGGVRYDGFDALTLNNGREDPTGLRTCLAYATFAAADVPAPGCTLAHVTVNGADLGVYANVEPVDERFLARRGFTPDGGLYEGTLSDFRDGWTGTFEPKTDASDVSHLDRVVDAVVAEDLDAIGAVVDLDAYFDFWTAEVLAGLWDGYDGNTNNFFVYDDPASGQIRFVPWGPDAAFDSATPFAAPWVTANSALARAVLAAPGGEDAYRARLEEALDAWDGDAMVDEVDRLAALAEPLQSEATGTAVDDLRGIVAGREDAIRAGLAAAPGGRTGALRDPPCFVARGSIAVTFATRWDTLDRNPSLAGSATLDLTWDGASVPLTARGAVAGAQGADAVVAAFASAPDGERVAYVYLPLDAMRTASIPFDFAEVVGVFQTANGGSPPKLAAYVGDGSLSFEAAGQDADAPVIGGFSGTLYAYGW